MSRWYRAYEGTVTDAKLGEAALIAGCSRSVSIAAWHCLLESAASRNNCGSFDATPRRVAVILCEPPATIEALFAAFVELGMIADSAVTSWTRRQFESDSSTERARKHRATRRNGDATLLQRDATPPDTDSETDKISVSNETPVVSPKLNGSEKPSLRPEHVVEAWNAMAERCGLAAIRKLTPERSRKLNGRLRTTTIDDWTEAIGAIERSSFLRGENERGWRADFDFLLQPKSFTKLIEGSYDRAVH